MHRKRVTYSQLENKSESSHFAGNFVSILNHYVLLTNWETHDIQSLINTPLYRFPKFLENPTIAF